MPKPGYLLLIFSVISMSMSMSACMTASSQPLELSLESKARCYMPEGVELTGNTLVISAGSQPTPGYAIQLTSQEQTGEDIVISYQVTTPPEGAIMAQVLTSPCTRVALPEDWNTLKVTNTSGQHWSFTR